MGENNTQTVEFKINLLSAYENKQKDLIKNLFLHEYKSPYDIKGKNLINTTIEKIKTDEITRILSSKKYITDIQKLEQNKMINMYLQIIGFLGEGVIDESFLKINGQYFANLTFKNQVKELNKAYTNFILNNEIGNALIDQNGRIKWGEIQKSHFKENQTPYEERQNKNGKVIKQRILAKQEEDWYNEWYDIFDGKRENGERDKIDISNFTKEGVQKLKKDFLNFENKLEIFIKNNKNDLLKVKMTEIIQKYLLDRGINLINAIEQESLKNNKITFEDTQKELALSSNDLKNKILKSTKPTNIHYEYKTIKGSFAASIGAENKRGFVAEDFREELENSLSFTLKLNGKNEDIKWEAKRVGGEFLNGKMQKMDNEIIIPELVTITNTKKRKGVKISTNRKNIHIGYSLKDYRDSDISLHSGGNLDKIREYLAQNTGNIVNSELSSATKNILKNLKTQDIRYILLNEGEKNRINNSRKQGFFKDLSEALSNLGPVFALSKITKENQLTGVDFLIINNKIIPGSYLFLALSDLVKIKPYHVTISPGEYPPGPDYTPDIVKTKGLYSSNFLQKYYKRNLQIFNRITFHVQLQNAFRELLMKRISEF